MIPIDLLLRYKRWTPATAVPVLELGRLWELRHVTQCCVIEIFVAKKCVPRTLKRKCAAYDASSAA